MHAAFLLPLLLLSSAAAAPDAAPAYTSAESIALGAGERWDYVTYDPVDHRAYVAHGDHVSRGGHRQAHDGRRDRHVSRRHARHCDRARRGLGYTDDAKAGEVIAFDLKTLQVVKKLKGDEDADGIVYDEPASTCS